MDLTELSRNINSLNDFLHKEKGKKEKLEEELSIRKKSFEEIKLELELVDKVNSLFRRTSEFARLQAKQQIESIVTKCLQMVFDKNIKFEIELSEQNNRPNAKFFVVNKIGEIDIKLDPEESRGGGIVDVVSLALRLAFLETHRPRIEGPLILDEPAKHVSNEYIFNVSNFLKEVSELFNRQIIMITHNDFLASIGSTSYEVNIENGISNVDISLSDLT